MTQPAQHRVLADIGDLVVAEQGPHVIVVDRARAIKPNMLNPFFPRLQYKFSN